MSDTTVKVTITGDTSAAEDALKRVTISAADFAKSLQAAGGLSQCRQYHLQKFPLARSTARIT